MLPRRVGLQRLKASAGQMLKRPPGRGPDAPEGAREELRRPARPPALLTYAGGKAELVTRVGNFVNRLGARRPRSKIPAGDSSA
jgi:hypothetical protein